MLGKVLDTAFGIAQPIVQARAQHKYANRYGPLNQGGMGNGMGQWTLLLKQNFYKIIKAMPTEASCVKQI